MKSHALQCRSRKYHCSSCGEIFLHSSTLRSHQFTCRQQRRAEAEVMLLHVCLILFANRNYPAVFWKDY